MLGAILGAVGGIGSSLLQKSQANKNIKMQREFAQHGIRWKVEDAKRAGLHPLAALGAQTNSFAPVQVGDSLAQAGQDIGRAIDSTRTHSERKGANGILGKLAVERASLENDLLRSQIAKNNQAGQAPARPSVDQRYMGADGQGGAAKLIVEKPMERTPQGPEPGQEPGSIVDRSFSRDPDGTYWVMPSKDAKDRMEDMPIPQTMWALRNMWPGSEHPPYSAPPGKYWTGGNLTGYRLKEGGLSGLRRYYGRY